MNDNKQFVTKEQYERELSNLRDELDELRQFKAIFLMFFPSVLRSIEMGGHLSIRKALEPVFMSHINQNGELTAEGLQIFSEFVKYAAKDKQTFLDGDFSMNGKAWKKVAEIQARTHKALVRDSHPVKPTPAEKDRQD